MTSNEIMTELKLTRAEFRALLPASGDGVFDHSGRRFKAERSGSGHSAKWVFTEIERPPVAAAAGGDDLAGMGSAELKEEKQRLECRLLRQKLKEERDAMQSELEAEYEAKLRRRLDPLSAFVEQHVPADKIPAWRKLVRKVLASE